LTNLGANHMARNRICFCLGICIFLVHLTGCGRYAHQAGWLSFGSEGLAPSLPPNPALPARGVVLRSAQNNRFEIAVSPASVSGLTTSVLAAAYQVSVTFHTDHPLPPGDPTVFFPLFNSPHLTFQRVAISRGSSDITVIVGSDAIGADLLLSTALSPRGFVGVITFSDGTSFPLEATVNQAWFGYATVWERSDKTGDRHVLLKSEVEIPVVIDSVIFDDGGTLATVTSGKVLRPHRSVKLRLTRPLANTDLAKFSVRKRILLAIPTDIGTHHPKFP
jgi:hypothetical protein